LFSKKEEQKWVILKSVIHFIFRREKKGGINFMEKENLQQTLLQKLKELGEWLFYNDLLEMTLFRILIGILIGYYIVGPLLQK